MKDRQRLGLVILLLGIYIGLLANTNIAANAMAPVFIVIGAFLFVLR